MPRCALSMPITEAWQLARLAPPRFFVVTRNGEGTTTRGDPHVGGGIPTNGELPTGAAAWSWDGRRLTVQVDRLGMAPLFYRELKGGVAVADRLGTLMEETGSDEFDWEALALYLRVGFFVGEDTPFRHVRCLPAGGILTWSAQDERPQVTAKGLPAPLEWRGSFDQAVDRFIELVRAAVKPAAVSPMPVLVPLSGGADSRHLLLALRHAGRQPEILITVRRPSLRQMDVEAATVLASALGYPHQVLDPAPWLEAEAAKNWEVSFVTKWHGWFTPLARFLATRRSLSVDGLGGDTFLLRSDARTKTNEVFGTGDPEAVARHMTRDENRWLSERMLVRLLRPEVLRPMPLEAATERMRQAILAHMGAPNPFASFMFTHRTRRDVGSCPYALFGCVSAVAAPYLEPDLLQFLRSLPFHLLQSGDLRKTAIRRGYPDTAHVPFNDELTAGPLDHAHEIAAARSLARHLLQEGLPHWTRQRYLLPRLLGILASREYASSARWLLGPLLYIHQLERIAG